jgi:phosphoketolase
MDNDRFVSLFTKDKPVIFAFHGYQRAACRTALQGAVAYAREHFEDPPEISEWVWR